MNVRAGALTRIATLALATLAGAGVLGLAGCTEKKAPEFDQDVVAMVNGWCMGGGHELALGLVARQPRGMRKKDTRD